MQVSHLNHPLKRMLSSCIDKAFENLAENYLKVGLVSWVVNDYES